MSFCVLQYDWDNIRRTLEVIIVQPKLSQVGEVADGRRDGACAPQERAGTFRDGLFVLHWFDTITYRSIC